ncbi:uncharacterized protein DDB_G0287625-like isoform X5 [Scomber scombrus]|uniref:Uncharacterized protein DDB_G0287625-like isoform X5 n=1 Tax=Scomber scombrus TaxID=13677 RepID=A0AAV1QDC5_SCOSC
MCNVTAALIVTKKKKNSPSFRDLLDFTDQDHYQSRMDQNQNPEHHADNPVKREESDSPSATTDTQSTTPTTQLLKEKNQTQPLLPPIHRNKQEEKASNVTVVSAVTKPSPHQNI